jgi:hypothetical protein
MVSFFATIFCFLPLGLQAANSHVKGFDLSFEYKNELERNLETIKNTFDNVEFSIKNSKLDKADGKKVVDFMTYFSGLQVAQKSLDHQESFLLDTSTDNHKKTFVLVFIAIGNLIEKQCKPILPFIKRYNLLSSEKVNNFSQALDTVSDISTKIYEYVYTKEMRDALNNELNKEDDKEINEVKLDPNNKRKRKYRANKKQITKKTKTLIFNYLILSGSPSLQRGSHRTVRDSLPSYGSYSPL